MSPSEIKALALFDALLAQRDQLREQRKLLITALQTAQMAMMGYTVRNDVINKALADCAAALKEIK